MPPPVCETGGGGEEGIEIKPDDKVSDILMDHEDRLSRLERSGVLSFKAALFGVLAAAVIIHLAEWIVSRLF